MTLVLIIITASACTFEEPTLPKWFTDWRIPIPNPGFVMSEAINDSTIIDTTYEDQSIIAISIIDSSERKRISKADMAFLPTGDKAEQGIGDVSLNSPGTEQIDPIPITDFIGIPIIPGQTIDIPASTINAPSFFLTFGSFEFVVNVKEGTIQIEFVNDSFLDFGADTKISIYDSLSQPPEFVGDARFSNPILAHTSQLSEPVDLAGRQFSNHLRFDMELQVLAKSGYTVQPGDEDGTIHFLATISELKVGYALAEIPEQNFSHYDSASTADQDDRIITAHIDGGTLLLEIENTLNVSANVNVELLNFYTDPDYNNVLSLDYPLEALQKDTFSIILDALYLTDYNNMPTPGSYIDFMKYRFFVKTIPSEEMVEISEFDSVILCIIPVDSVYIKEFKGDLARREFVFDPVEQNDVIDSEGFEGSIRFEEISMTLSVFNQIGMELLVNLNIEGFKNNKTESIQLTFDDNPIQVGARKPGEDVNVHTVVLDKDNSNLVEFIEFLPEDIIITGIAIVEGVGEVTLEDEVWSNYHIFSPFFIKIRDNAQYTSKLDSAEINNEVRTAILKGYVDQSTFNLRLINGLPIGAQMKAYFSINPDNIFDETITDSSEKMIIDDIYFQSGELNSDGYVYEIFDDSYFRPLSNKELSIFANPTVYIATKVFLDDTEGEGLVKFRSTDEIRANGAIQFRYSMEELKGQPWR